MKYEELPKALGYWKYDGLSIQADVEAHQSAVEMAVRVLDRGSTILDLAAGQGALAKALVDAGFEVSCTSWNDRVGVDVPCYRIDLDYGFSCDDVGAKKFDMICAIEVIEHVENPAQLLRSCAGLVKRDGYMIISTPNVESASARLEWLLRGCPYSFDTHEIVHNRHISVMWRQGLEEFIALAGFDIVDKRLVGKQRYHNKAQALLKRPIHALMAMLLDGDLCGNSRMYLLRRTGSNPKSLGAEDVA